MSRSSSSSNLPGLFSQRRRSRPTPTLFLSPYGWRGEPIPCCTPGSVHRLSTLCVGFTPTSKSVLCGPTSLGPARTSPTGQACTITSCTITSCTKITSPAGSRFCPRRPRSFKYYGRMSRLYEQQTLYRFSVRSFLLMPHVQHQTGYVSRVQSQYYASKYSLFVDTYSVSNFTCHQLAENKKQTHAIPSHQRCASCFRSLVQQDVR